MARKLFPDVSSFRTASPAGRYAARAGSVFALVLFTVAARGSFALAAASYSLQEADARLAVAQSLLEGGIYDQAKEIALSILNDDAFREPGNATHAEAVPWLQRREAARFTLERGRFGLAHDTEEYLDIAEEFAFLFQNRYRLPSPAYHLQSAYWAARAYQEAGDYDRAVAMYSRVGGFNLPPGMEGDAARRTSECLREMAEALPYPGDHQDRQLRNRLLDQAIDELGRARNAMAVGRERKELELDLISLRLARREPDYLREALAEAEAFMTAEAARDALRARAALYRAMASERLGDAEDAITWFRAVVNDENPDAEDRRTAEMGLALALRELSENRQGDERTAVLRESVQAFQRALADAGDDARFDRARTILALTLLDLGQPSVALEAINPILRRGDPGPSVRYAAGRAELARGRPEEALTHFLAASRPSSRQRWLRLDASRSAAAVARRRGDHGLGLAMEHQASRLFREDRIFAALLTSEFAAMESLLAVGKTGARLALTGDEDLVRGRDESAAQSIETRQRAGVNDVARALGALLASGGGADAAYDLAIMAEATQAWANAGLDDLEAAIAIIGHLKNRQPRGVSATTILSREGEAHFALAMTLAQMALDSAEPRPEEIERVLNAFARATVSYQAAAVGDQSGADSLDQGVVNLSTGDFLLKLSERFNKGQWAGRSVDWRREAVERIESSIRPFDQAMTRSAPGSAAAMRSRWMRARALELLQEWRPAANAYAAIMNNTEAPRVLRVNAARRWTACLNQLGEYSQAMSRIATFAQFDPETAFLAGELAEKLGDIAAAYQHYLFAADPDVPVIPPETPGLRQEAAYKAGMLALHNPREVDRLNEPETVREEARELLARTARADPNGPWTIGILQELARSRLAEADGWRSAYRIATQAAEQPGARPALRRAMHMLASEALTAGEQYAEALDELDLARELIEQDPTPDERVDVAAITLAMADIYRLQGRYDDALRAYADVFASYPDAAEQAEQARIASARMILSRPGAGPREHEQARAILSGLANRSLAEDILGGR